MATAALVLLGSACSSGSSQTPAKTPQRSPGIHVIALDGGDDAYIIDANTKVCAISLAGRDQSVSAPCAKIAEALPRTRELMLAFCEGALGLNNVYHAHS